MLIKKYFKSYFTVIIIFIIILNPQLMHQAIINGMIICYNSVIPSLYIFMIIANYRAQPEIMHMLSIPFRWYAGLMKIDDLYYAGSLSVSLLGGFAVGATYLKRLEARKYPVNALKVLSISMINNSFAFCAFAIGYGYLGNILSGILIYVSLTISSLITSFIYSFLYKYNIVSFQEKGTATKITFVDSVKKAVESILVICGFVILSNYTCEAFKLYSNNNIFFTVLSSIMTEVTCGTLNLINYFGKNIYYICFSLSIFPICTLCQVYYFTQNTDIIKTLISSRIIHTPVSLMILSIIINLFPQAALINSSIVPVFSLVSDSVEISSVLFIITLLFLIIFDKNKMFTK